MNAYATNLKMLEIVADGLKELIDEVAFVGGATTALYLSEDASIADSEIRSTEDVDCVIEVASRFEFSKIETRLRGLGFKNSMQGPICRWIYLGITVDIMPTDDKILGFANQWYKQGILTAEEKVLPNNKKIRVFNVAHFLASKTEAFRDRGKNDFQGSKDFEDIITVVDGRSTIREDLNKFPDDIRKFLHASVAEWDLNQRFAESIMGHLPGPRRTIEGARRVLDILRNI